MPRTWRAKNLTDPGLRVNRDFWVQASSSFGRGAVWLVIPVPFCRYTTTGDSRINGLHQQHSNLLVEDDLRAIYEYLSTIPCLEGDPGNPNGSDTHFRRCH